jgi:Fe-S oxidoreductase
MYEQDYLDEIRSTGILGEHFNFQKRDEIVRQKLQFIIKNKAEYVILASCKIPFEAPADMKFFRMILEQLKVDYSVLEKEYCCGAPVLPSKNLESKEQKDTFARKMQNRNREQIDKLGAKSIVSICIGCYVLFKRFQSVNKNDIQNKIGFNHVEAIWYPTLLSRFFQNGTLTLKADYYAGCQRAYLKSSPSVSMDLESPLSALKRVEGLELNNLDNTLCCRESDQVKSLLESCKTDTIITVCPACTTRVKKEIAHLDINKRVVSLSQVLFASVTTHYL